MPCSLGLSKVWGMVVIGVGDFYLELAWCGGPVSLKFRQFKSAVCDA